MLQHFSKVWKMDSSHEVVLFNKDDLVHMATTHNLPDRMTNNAPKSNEHYNIMDVNFKKLFIEHFVTKQEQLNQFKPNEEKIYEEKPDDNC